MCHVINKGNMHSHINLLTSVFDLIPKTKQKDAIRKFLPHVDLTNRNEKNETLLHILVREGHADWIEEVLSFEINSEANLDIRGPDGNSPLMTAAEYGQLDILELLIEKGADVNARNCAYCNALHLATMNSHFNCVNELISSKCDVNIKDLTGVTPLIIATFCGHKEIFDLLLLSGADVNIRDMFNQNALHYATLEGNIEFVEKLTEARIELNIPRKMFGRGLYGSLHSVRTPLMIAAEKGFSEIVKFLLKHGISDNIVNEHNYNALLLAASNGHIECFKLLGGVNTVIKSSSGAETPLIVAAGRTRKNIIEYLLDLKCNINYFEQFGNAVNYLIEGLTTNHTVDILETFVAAGLNINLMGQFNRTPLLWAAEWNSDKVVKILLSSGADISVRHNGATALHYAARNSNFLVTKELVKAKIDLDLQDNFGQTALIEVLKSYIKPKSARKIAHYLIRSGANIHLCDKRKINALNYAVEGGYFSIVVQLISAHIDMNLLSYDAKTPLMTAISRNYVKIAHYLIDSGADISVRDNRGKSTLDYAFQSNNLELIKHLVQAGVDVEIPRSIKISEKILEYLLSTCGDKYDIFSKDGLDALYFAVSCGNMVMTQELIATADNINFEYPEEQTTILMVAASKGNPEILTFLLKSGATANYLNEKGQNALHFAQNLACAQSLVEAGVNFHIEDINGFTPLIKAAQSGRTEVVSYLLDLGAKKFEKNNYNAWRVALDYGHRTCAELLDSDLNQGDFELFLTGLRWRPIINPQCLEYLIQRNVDLNIQDESGMSLIHYANVDCLKKVLAYKQTVVDIDAVNKKGETALILAAKDGDYHRVKTLINFGADVNIQDIDGRNALHSSCCSQSQWHFDETLLTLLNTGIDVNAVDKSKKTALILLLENPDYYNLRDVYWLLESGADCNISDVCGQTPLLMAIIKGKKEVIMLIVRSGADVNSRNDKGQTPLLLAIEKGHWDIVDLLLKRGGDIDMRNNNGRTPLLISIENGHLDIVQLLLKLGADIDMKNNNGRTPLMVAVEKDRSDIVDLLLQSGADIKIRDENDKDAFAIACSNCSAKCLELLLPAMKSRDKTE